MSDIPNDQELHVVKRFTTPGVAEALTLEDWKKLTKDATRNLTDEPIQRRRGTANRNQITAHTYGEFL